PVLLDLAGVDPKGLAVRKHQLSPGVGHLLDDARVFVARFRFDERGAIAHSDGGRWLEEGANQLSFWPFVARSEEIRPCLASASIHCMASAASTFVCKEKLLAPADVS